MKRIIPIASLFLCFTFLLTACGGGNAKKLATLQEALQQADALEYSTVTITTTTTAKAQDGSEQTSQSTQTIWRNGQDTLVELVSPYGETGSEQMSMLIATINGVTYQKFDQEWQQAYTAIDFSWMVQAALPSDPANYNIQQDGNTFLLKANDKALQALVQKEVDLAKAQEAEMRANGQEAEADAQAVVGESWAKSSYVQREITVFVDDTNLATGCTRHIILEGYSVDSPTPGEFVLGDPVTLELTVSTVLTNQDESLVANKINQVISEIK